MKIQIHQIQVEKDKKHLCFMNYEFFMKHNEGIIPKSIYDCVFTGEIEAENLEDIFRIFNIEHPKDYTGRSLSVSDVVEIQYEDKSEFFFCDSIGFKMIVFDKSLIEGEVIKTVPVIDIFSDKKENARYWDDIEAIIAEAIEKVAGKSSVLINKEKLEEYLTDITSETREIIIKNLEDIGGYFPVIDEEM